MRVGREDDRIRLSGPKLGRDIGLRLGPDLAHHLVPLAVGEPRGVVPRLDLSVEAGVGPQMMAVRREVQALDQDQPIYNVRTMDDVVANSLGTRRVSMQLFAVFAIDFGPQSSGENELEAPVSTRNR